MSVFMSMIGIITLIAVGFFCSAHRDRIRWRTVIGALITQLSFGFFFLRSFWAASTQHHRHLSSIRH